MKALIQQILVTGVVVSAIALMVCSTQTRRQRKHSDGLLDKSLKDTYPASDPTATQDFAIPVNRQ
jgi:hypothetical protein